MEKMFKLQTIQYFHPKKDFVLKFDNVLSWDEKFTIIAFQFFQ